MLDFIHRYVIKATIINGIKENGKKNKQKCGFHCTTNRKKN